MFLKLLATPHVKDIVHVKWVMSEIWCKKKMVFAYLQGFLPCKADLLFRSALARSIPFCILHGMHLRNGTRMSQLYANNCLYN